MALAVVGMQGRMNFGGGHAQDISATNAGCHSKDADVYASMLLQNDCQSPLHCVCLIRLTFYLQGLAAGDHSPGL